MSYDERMDAAERSIQEILRTLEAAEGALVDKVEIVDIEVTSVDDARPMILRSVRIHINPVPGARWAE